MPINPTNIEGTPKPNVELELDVTIPTPELDPINPPIPDPVPPVDPNPTVLEENDIVTIDDVDYTIDINGNALNDKGEIIYDKAALDIALKPEVPIDPIIVDPNIESLNSLSNLVVEIEGVTPAFTPEYIIAREKAIIDQTTEIAKQEAMNEFMSANPDIASIVTYKEKFGSLEGYGNQIDYSKIDFTKLDATGQTEIIIQAEMKRGNTRERAEKIAKLSEGDALAIDAKEALTYLATEQATRIQIRQNDIQRQHNEYVALYNNETGVAYDDNGTPKNLNVKGSVHDDIINNGKLLNFDIPSKGIIITKDDKKVLLNRQELVDYLSKPVYTDEDKYISQAEADLFDKLQDRKYRSLLAIIAMNGLESLVNAEAQKKLVVKVKQQAHNVNNPHQGVKPLIQTSSKLEVSLD